MSNAMVPFVPLEPTQVNIPGALATGYKLQEMQQANAMNALKMQETQKAIANEKMNAIVRKYAGPVTEMQRQYFNLEKRLGREAAVKEMQAVWTPWQKSMVADGLENIPTQYDSAVSAKFLNDDITQAFIKSQTSESVAQTNAASRAVAADKRGRNVPRSKLIEAANAVREAAKKDGVELTEEEVLDRAAKLVSGKSRSWSPTFGAKPGGRMQIDPKAFKAY